MRHKVAGRRLSRTKEHRLALRRNLAASLFEHETISTTMEKAKEVRSFAEKLITLAREGTLAARRRAISMLGDRDIISYEDGKAVSKGTIIQKLFSELGPRYLERPGGYTRIIRLSLKRLGDNGQLVLLQLVAEGETKAKKGRHTEKVVPVEAEPSSGAEDALATEPDKADETEDDKTGLDSAEK